MKNLNAHTTFLNVINLLVVAGILCILAPNAVDRNRESTFEEWMESTQVEDTSSQESSDQLQEDSDDSSTANSGDTDSKHEITSLYAAWFYFHQSVTLGHGVIFDTSTWKHFKFSSDQNHSPDSTFTAVLTDRQSLFATFLSLNESALKSNKAPELEIIHHSVNINAP